ncbi:MAG TPA: ATP-dependent protease ATPase subunit HslU [Candidatus Limadaptatus stercorigallinarum]|uniref:ATP-dependent protease ATPase subunit HslU n=1 Tax=Candidatus Limadaptatus stercorigallinarum TaxID=2840845 RepID=A0A9D1HSU4_9FIRM|nr:ATP-dependent protease ATPase subunit HslU [Candidatus Limadaptatus stercorigallinarum]
MELTPKQIVKELDRYIIGQQDAKIAVAIALRNRYRRSRLPEEMREEITPKNILMKGPTGVGKTEIARRLAKLVRAPFVKVEATKFTEVGYVGRDVESIIRDLVEVSVRMVKEEKFKEVMPRATEIAENNLVELLLPIRKKVYTSDKSDAQLKEELLSEIRAGHLDGITIEMEIKQQPKPIQLTSGNAPGNEIDLGNIFGGMMGVKKKKRKLTVKQAMDFIVNQEAEKMVDQDAITSEALARAEQDGVVFLDEIDKVAARAGRDQGHDVSREGVQRDILPIVEGSTVQTKYGSIRTDFILFIAAGAFHMSKMEDLIPELQGRFPIRVELDNLTEDDFVKILTEPDNAVLKQYKALLGVDGVELDFTEDAIREIARTAYYENENSENLGARRLHAVLEHLLKDVLYEADDNETKEIHIDKDYVTAHLATSLRAASLRKYIL